MRIIAEVYLVNMGMVNSGADIFDFLICDQLVDFVKIVVLNLIKRGL